MAVIAVCRICGESFTARRSTTRGICPRVECRKAAKAEWQRHFLEKKGCLLTKPKPLSMALERKVVGVFVVSVPLCPGGFESGTYFGKDEWRQMFRLAGFTPGTVLRDAQNRLYEYQYE